MLSRVPGLSTRANNKTVRPGVRAGLEPQSRRTKPEMAQAREDEVTARAKEKIAKQQALKRVAAIEDEHQQQDAAYALNANHPVDQPFEAEPESDIAPRATSESEEEFAPPLEDGSEEDDDDDFGGDDTSEDDRPKSKKKVPATSRADVKKSRSTQDSTGTPATAETKKRKPEASSRPPKKNKKAKTSGAPKKLKSGLNDSGASQSQAATRTEDDSMVAPGGPAMDDDKGEHVERAKKQKRGKPSDSLIAITAVAPKTTKKAVRNGHTKWTLKDLPVGTSERFTDEVVPLTKELVGGVDPWEGASIKQVQSVVDRVFGLDEHKKPMYKVAKDDAWVGLVNYRLNDWRGVFGTQDEDDDAQDDDQAPRHAEGVREHDGDEPMTAADQSDALPAAKQWNFKTSEGIAEYVEWALMLHAESGTMPFHWKQWGNGVDKQGFLEDDLILYTFATHLTMLETIPKSYTRSTAPPIGALLLATQARALGFWRTGVYDNPTPTPRAKYFSFDVWGDYTKPTGDKKGSQKLVRRATKFVGGIQRKWDAERWATFTKEAETWMERPTRRRAGTVAAKKNGRDGSGSFLGRIASNKILA
ncbi:hypothetical protein DFH06DRAFT_752525 [Mycena polygramma]|nr:hypothetical protein DFH06DRAFT_752525 [Mycena polygramma]